MAKRDPGIAERLLVGAVLGLGVGFSLLFVGPVLALLLAAIVSVFAYLALSAAGAGAHLLIAGLVTVAVYLPSLLFRCGGGRAALDGNGTIVACIGQPSPMFVVAALIGGASALLGLVLIATSLRRRGRQIQ